MDFRNEKKRGMRCRIDDKSLARLVLHEACVKKQFERIASLRWVDPAPNVVDEYEELRELAGHVSLLVDLAFYLKGFELGVVRPVREHPTSGLRRDLEALVHQLRKPSWHLPVHRESQRIALVV